MNSMKIASQRIVYAVAIFIMAIALILPAIASAAQVTSRSVGLSSSSAGATAVDYTINFTPAADAGAFVVDFCGNTPLIGQDCLLTDTDAEGFTAASATVASGGTLVSAAEQRVVVTAAMTEGTPVSVTLSGITNPTAAGNLFARILTFADSTAASASTPTSVAGAIDEGGVAIAITDTIGVSGVVLETLTFCVSGSEIGVNCAGTTSPAVPLGEELEGSDMTVLTPGQLETGNIYTQVTTNAVNGVVVRLKSNAVDCGGLMRFGDTVCHILPAAGTGIGVDEEDNSARFGVKTNTAASYATDGASNPNGTLVPVAPYNETNYRMNYVTDNATGVTSTFGDVFMNTASAPASNQNMQLNFAATVSNNTPAGVYSADVNLIATGTF